MYKRQIAVIGTHYEFLEFLQDNKKYPSMGDDFEYINITCKSDCKDKSYHGLRFLKSCDDTNGIYYDIAQLLLNRKPLKDMTHIIRLADSWSKLNEGDRQTALQALNSKEKDYLLKIVG